MRRRVVVRHRSNRPPLLDVGQLWRRLLHALDLLHVDVDVEAVRLPQVGLHQRAAAEGAPAHRAGELARACVLVGRVQDAGAAGLEALAAVVADVHRRRDVDLDGGEE